MDLAELTEHDTAAVVALVNACAAVDAPWAMPRTHLHQQMEMRHGWDGEPGRYFLATDGGDVVGLLVAHTSNYDNLELVWFELAIDPPYRRRGLGSELHARAIALALEINRPLVLFGGWDAKATRGFAAAFDYPLASVAVARLQHLTGSVDERARFAVLRADAERFSEDYDLVRISGRTPAQYEQALVDVTAVINDAPTDDLVYEAEVFEVARVQAYETAQIDSGRRFRRILAVERATGVVAGHTVVVVDAEQPAYGEQHDTAVVRAHRGHRLGLRLKSEMLCWLADEEPQLRRLQTENAESNDSMIGINELLGYQIASRQLVYQRRIS
jgi:GNAT superfamily N-acetyltransferase